MVTHIRMKNFKSWQDSGEVKLAPLTGFFGTNSSGKSSLLQMLLLLKQTAEHADSEEIFFFGDESSHINLGNFREVIHAHNLNKSLELEFGTELMEPRSVSLPIRGHGLWKSKIDLFTFNTVVRVENQIPAIQNLSYAAPSNSWKIVWKSGNTRGIHQGTQFLNGTPIGSAYVQNCYGKPTTRNIGVSWDRKLLRQTSLIFENLFLHIHYLGPTRVNPLRSYTWEGSHPEHPGQWGDQAIDALLSARARNLKTLHEAEEVPIEQRVSYWLQEMGLAHSFALDWTSGKTYEVRIQKTSSSPPVTLADMGYGLTQFLPVLVLCYYASEGSTLILEQPGIHLHPKVQSQLADLLIEVVNERNLQILVESHSEHFLNRLQRRIAEEDITPDKTALYFCRNEEGVSTIERLKMDEFGNIANWPENFFGDEMGDLFAMTEAQKKRQKKAEG